MSTKKRTSSVARLEKKFGSLSLGRFLVSWRLCEGLSQREFADRLQISAANLCDIETGRKGVGIYKAVEIAKIINYSPTVLVQLALQEQVCDAGFDFKVEVRQRKTAA